MVELVVYPDGTAHDVHAISSDEPEFGAAAVEGNLSSGSFGQAVSATAPRLMQLALRYRF